MISKCESLARPTTSKNLKKIQDKENVLIFGNEDILDYSATSKKKPWAKMYCKVRPKY